MASPAEFHASMADVTNEQYQNMAGLVQADDFNAEVVVRFLRNNGIDAHVDESTAGFRYTAANAACAEDVLFACVCLRASISYALGSGPLIASAMSARPRPLVRKVAEAATEPVAAAPVLFDSWMAWRCMRAVVRRHGLTFETNESLERS